MSRAARGGVPARIDPQRERAELEEYLGEGFDQTRLERWQEQLDEELAEVGDEERFYRASEGYLYNLTVFAMSETKLPYLQDLVGLLEPGARVLDYGCGIGSDGLALLESGFEVEFADFANPSTEYLRWRLARRGLDAPIHDLDREVPSGFDAGFAFDVAEHLADPAGLLDALAKRCGVCMVNLLEQGADEPEIHHRELPIGRLRQDCLGRGLISYRIYHRRSHLITYRGGRSGGRTAPGPAQRLSGRARIAAELTRRRIAPR